MTHILKNENLEIHIEDPLEGYKFSRFDWTGKITGLRFQDVLMSSKEREDAEDENIFGKGFYNEFGMDKALGFEETEVGDWFHKIGVGLLRKDSDTYNFLKSYEIKPANFSVNKDSDKIEIICQSQSHNGYSYILKKVITISSSGFTVDYHLENTGEKDILTEEYNHNFIAINQARIGPDYELCFPFKLISEYFNERVNPEKKVIISEEKISFNGTPEEPFFFSNLSGSKPEMASWELIHLNSKLGISETASFKTDKINLWGWGHVISPELFYKIHLRPKHELQWSRCFKVFHT